MKWLMTSAVWCSPSVSFHVVVSLTRVNGRLRELGLPNICEGFVVAQLAITDPNKVQSRQDARRVNLELADELGLQIARLFDEYITNPLGQNLR